MISQWEKEFNVYAKTQRRRTHLNRDRDEMKHAISREVFEFIKGKDILHELIHPHSIGKENIPINGAQTQDIPRPPHDFNMDTLLEDMDSLLEPILMQDFDMDSLLEPTTLQDYDMDSLLEPNVTLIEDMDSLSEPITMQDFDMDSPLEPITFDSLVEDMDSLLEPITFDWFIEDMDSLLEPIIVEDKDSLLEPIAFNNSSNVDEFNEILCRLDSLLEPVVLVERC